MQKDHPQEGDYAFNEVKYFPQVFFAPCAVGRKLQSCSFLSLPEFLNKLSTLNGTSPSNLSFQSSGTPAPRRGGRKSPRG